MVGLSAPLGFALWHQSAKGPRWRLDEHAAEVERYQYYSLLACVHAQVILEQPQLPRQ